MDTGIMKYNLYNENGEECEPIECEIDGKALKTMLDCDITKDTKFTFEFTTGGKTMKRDEILNKAKSIVCGERQDQYGNPEDNFQSIADLWTTYLNCELNCDRSVEPVDVACMMILLKIARIGTGAEKEDNWIDIAGYAACGGEVESV